MIRKMLFKGLSIFYKLINFPALYRKGVITGKNVIIQGKLGIHGDRNAITIGNNVTLTSTDKVNPTGGFHRLFLTATGGGKIIIGDQVGISLAAITARKRIVIENGVLIGAGVSIFDNDFHSVLWENRIKNPDPDVKSAEVVICRNAFVGARSIILKGVIIGENSVIAAGSVVTKNIPPNEIWGGNPARFLKKVTE